MRQFDTFVNPDREVRNTGLKMENKIRALRAGVVYSVAGVAGQRVEQDAALLVLA